MRRSGTLVAILLVLTAGACGGVRPERVDDGSPERCAGADGSPIDVAHEPEWRFRQYHDWADRDGCLVRIDVITDRPGPDHCGWEAARVIATGMPIGARFTTDADAIEYVRDPDGVFDDRSLTVGLQLDAALPDDAIDTGFRQAHTELWAVPDNPAFIYLKNRDQIERWPAGKTPRCA
jgi:hypothetical protein